MPPTQPIVRDYVSPQDSTALIDYMMDLYTNTNTVLPKGVNIEDIPRIYSEQVAGLPINFTSDMSVAGRRGEYVRTPISIGDGYAHGAIDKEIRIDSTKRTGWGDMENPNVSILRNWKNTLSHEAFGHALPESIFGYKPEDTVGSELSGRSEMLPYLLQSISNLGKADKELFFDKNGRSRKPTYPVGQDFDDTQAITKHAIEKLEPLVQGLLKDINK